MLNSAIESLLAVLFPANCRLCGRPLLNASLVPLCSDCIAALVPIEGPLCAVCGERVQEEGTRCRLCERAAPAFTRALACGPYNGAWMEAIHLLKYDGVMPLAKLLGALLSPKLLAAAAECEGTPLVVPVPLYAGRERERRFNQAEAVARAAVRAAGAPGRQLQVDTRALRRARETASQTGLTRKQRRDNVQGAFRADAARVRGRDVILVDDVMTTGATAQECSRVLLRAGARRVLVATVARVLRDANQVSIGREAALAAAATL